MLAQHLAQRLVHQVRGRVVAHGGRTPGTIDLRADVVADRDHALRHHPVMAVHLSLDLLRVVHLEARRAADQHPAIAHLATAFGIERGFVEHHDARLPRLELGHRRAFVVERHHLGLRLQVLVAHEAVIRPRVVQHAVHLELARCARLRLLPLHRGLEARHIDAHATLAAHVVGQIERKAVGVVQFERHVARQRRLALGQRRFQNLHTVAQRLEKALLLGLQHVHDALRVGRQVGVGLAHLRHQVGHQPVEKRRLAAQLVAVADGAADDAPLHVAAPLVAGDDAIGHQEGRGANVVGDHTQAGAAQIGGPRLTRRRPDEGLEQVDIVVAMHPLQNGRDTLQPHAGVHAGRGQRPHRSVGLHVELHEHVVPDFDVAVAVGIGAAGRPARHLGPVVVEDLGTRAARAGVGHHPEVVALVLAALVVADAHHALGRQADFLGPDVVGLVVLVVHRGP